MSEAKKTLYGFGFNVRPLPEHPQFWRMQSAMLWIFTTGAPGLNAENFKDSEACHRAIKIVPRSLFEWANGDIGFNSYDDDYQHPHYGVQITLQTARTMGFSAFMQWVGIGDEDLFIQA